jgi:uncharacterized damage-inducible protein DinB
MPGNPPPFRTEREGLLLYLRQQRDGLKYAAYGLTEEQIRLRPTRSALTIGGLLKHAASTERGWTQLMVGGSGGGTEESYDDEFRVADSDTLTGLLAQLDEVAGETEAATNALESLDVTVSLPEAPWYPSDPSGYSARWILLHVLEELARHAGHADILREHIDGATMVELMAGAEGWPETEWIKPWRPPAAPSDARPPAARSDARPPDVGSGAQPTAEAGAPTG